MTFLIQSKIINGFEIPAQDFGYSIIEAIDYHHWFNENNEYEFILCENITQDIIRNVYLKGLINNIPVGSVEFCLDFYSRFGIKNIKPLNIPKCLWNFVKRYICIDYCKNVNGHWFLKSTKEIKSSDNGECWFNGDGGENEKYFLTEWINNVASEWRVFIYNKKILGLKCYSGNEWILPDRKYIEEIVKSYDKKSYTLDVMVTNNMETDIVELHDMFATGLYGFNHPKLLNMMITTHREICA